TFERAWDSLSEPGAGTADDFQFPFRDVKIPPSTLQQTDRAQQLFLTTSMKALRDAGLLSGRTVDRPDRIATVVATASGSEASLHRNERIRADEFQELLASAGADSGMAAAALRGWRASLEGAFAPGPDTTTEAALPGYMDNIVAGRVGNCFDLRGTNYIVDSDLSSFGAAVCSAAGILQADDADAVLIGGVNAVVAPEMAELWSRRLGEAVRLMEASVSLVVRRATDITDADHVLGYLKSTPQRASGTPEPRVPTALGADGAIWAFRQLLTLATEPAAEGDEIELRSAFQDTAHRLALRRRPCPRPPIEQPTSTGTTTTPVRVQPVVVEGTDLDELISRLRTAGVDQQNGHAAPGGLRLVFDPSDGDPVTRLLHVVADLHTG
ncbi:MAG: beta-ketoacyl synthase N-terminal-like domain-containing protein, partial [Propionibacteriaceae bacterium]|nr:beta-ketoacyl synthase N-terminal-like domain-containing protein [Propionibacteriaceae bacterium]